ncbi:hypothetical protein [Candidatus Poriferisocius sp.]|uniref:hypothetical protein n=1 Tax=Candidatus Poriferisocius sp. TaxID=3101276 RepID=UPI003B01C87B
MSDDAFTTESDQPMSEDTAAEEPEEPMAQGSPEAADEDGGNGGGNGMLGPIEIPSTSRMLVGLGGAVMALSTLFSWVELGSDSFPNIAGVGTSTIGVGLVVFLVGLSFLLRSKSVAATLGMALGAFAITLIFIVVSGTDNDALGIGAWIGLAGTAVAVLGALLLAFESSDRPELEFVPMPAALGAALAVVASFWIDWMLSFGSYLWYGLDEEGPLNGLDPDVLFGVPILILGGIALVLIVELVTVPRMVFEGRRQVLLAICRTAGIAITVIAGANVAGMVMLGLFIFGSGPLVALVGGIMLTRSIREA